MLFFFFIKFNCNFNYTLYLKNTNLYLPYFNQWTLPTKHLYYFFKKKFLIFSFSNDFFKLNSFFFFINKLNFYYFQLFFFKNSKFLKNFFFFLKINNSKLFIIDKFYKKLIKNVLISLKFVFYELKFIIPQNQDFKIMIYLFNYWFFLFKINTLKTVLIN